MIKIFKDLVQDPDLEWEFIDGSIVRAHQYSSGGVGDENQAIGKKKNSRTGNADIDWSLYKYRHLVENVFARLKHFRAIATR